VGECALARSSTVKQAFWRRPRASSTPALGMWSKQSNKTGSPDERHLCMYLFIADNHRWTIGEQPVYLGHK